MAHLFDKYPELILFDATYKLNNHNLPLFLQLCIDGNGNTEIVYSFVVVNLEKELIVCWTFLRNLIPAGRRPELLLVTRIFADRVVYKEKFPNIVL